MRQCARQAARRLEEVFRRIQRERMGDLPLLNRRLRVEAVGFRPWEGGHLGILVTPWFMNIVWLPAAGTRHAPPPPGGAVEHRLPAGTYRFVVGEEEGLGRYRSCSLFSPVLEFEDHAAAVTAAEAAMEVLMARDGRPPPSPAGTPAGEVRKMSRRTLLRRMVPGLEP